MPSRRRWNQGHNPNYNNPGQPGYQGGYPQGPRGVNTGNNGNNNRHSNSPNGSFQGNNMNSHNQGNNRNSNNNTPTNNSYNNGNNQRRSNGNGRRREPNLRFTTRPCYWCQDDDHTGYECGDLGCPHCEQLYPNDPRKFQRHAWSRCRLNPSRIPDDPPPSYSLIGDDDDMIDIGEVPLAAQPVPQSRNQPQAAPLSLQPCFTCGAVGQHDQKDCPQSRPNLERFADIVPRATMVQEIQLQFHVSEDIAIRILESSGYSLRSAQQAAEYCRQEISRFRQETGMTGEQTRYLLDQAGWDHPKSTWRFDVLWHGVAKLVETFAANAEISFDEALFCYREAGWNANKAVKVWKKYKLSSATSMKPGLAKRVLKRHDHDYATASRAANAVFEEMKTETGMTDADTKALLNTNNWDKAAAMDEFKKVARATLMERVGISETDASFYLEQGKWNQFKAMEAYKIDVLDKVHVQTGFDLHTANAHLKAVKWNLAEFWLSLVQELHCKSGLSRDTCLVVLESQGGNVEKAAQALQRKKVTATARDYVSR